MTMTREDAIQEYGLSVVYYMGGFRLYRAYSHISDIKQSLNSWHGGGIVRQVLGSPQSKSAENDRENGFFDQFVDRYCFDKRNEADLDEIHVILREMIKAELLNHLTTNHKVSWLKKQFWGDRSKESIWNMYAHDDDVRAYIDRIKVEIDFLPDELDIEKSSLSVGDKIYQVVVREGLSTGIEIKKHTLTQKIANPVFEENSLSHVLNYDPYMIAQDDCGGEIVFCHSDRDGFASYPDWCKPLYLFATQEDASAFRENKIMGLSKPIRKCAVPRPA